MHTRTPACSAGEPANIRAFVARLNNRILSLSKVHVAGAYNSGCLCCRIKSGKLSEKPA